MNRLARLPIHLYRWTLSYFLGRHCRYQPSCSAYALEAIETHGALRGYALALKRIGRCHPWGGAGYDPVPEAEKT
jgi:putative membrane protein insertion efficiency factor